MKIQNDSDYYIVCSGTRFLYMMYTFKIKLLKFDNSKEHEVQETIHKVCIK